MAFVTPIPVRAASTTELAASQSGFLGLKQRGRRTVASSDDSASAGPSRVFIAASSGGSSEAKKDAPKPGSFAAIMERKQTEIQQQLEVLAAIPDHPVRKVMETTEPRQTMQKLLKAIQKVDFCCIAEIKRRMVAPLVDISEMRKIYKMAGATSLSVITDIERLQDSALNGLEDLRTVVETEGLLGVPSIRKDYVVHPVQVAEAVEAGGAGIVLIAPILGKGLDPMVKYCRRVGIEPIVEVRNPQEAELALSTGAQIIGTYLTQPLVPKKSQEELLDAAKEIQRMLPSEIISLCGNVKEAEDGDKVKDAGFSGVYLWDSTLTLQLGTIPGKLIADIMKPAEVDAKQLEWMQMSIAKVFGDDAAAGGGPSIVIPDDAKM
eukprot:tig00020801_g13897.t1